MTPQPADDQASAAAAPPLHPAVAASVHRIVPVAALGGAPVAVLQLGLLEALDMDDAIASAIAGKRGARAGAEALLHNLAACVVDPAGGQPLHDVAGWNRFATAHRGDFATLAAVVLELNPRDTAAAKKD
jgi:hypothetical protein